MLGVFFDTETNGLNPKVHKLVELAYKIADLSTGEVIDEYETMLRLSEEDWAKSDPESLRINGFSFGEMSKKGKPPAEAAEELIERFHRLHIQRKKAVFICQNPSFDRVFLAQLIDPDKQERLLWPYHWLDLASMYWALAMERAQRKEAAPPWETGFSKDLIAAKYKIPPEKKPHRAMNGVAHLFLCYSAVVGFC